jgi:ribonuclease VapC
MVLDTSVIIAILRNEADADIYRKVIEHTEILRLGAPTLLECEMVARRALGDDGSTDLDNFLIALDVHVEPFGRVEADYARYAYRHFGKGRHPAGLNFGDCLTYATAVAQNEALLFKGDDFAQTNITNAYAQWITRKAAPEAPPF